MTDNAFLASISLAAMVIAAPTAAQAQAQIQNQNQTYPIDTPAGSTKDTLLAISRATHQSIIFDSALLRGHRSAAIKGQLTVPEAIKRALAGTDLVAVLSSNGVWHLERAPAVSRLPDSDSQIVVTGTHIRGVPPAAQVKTITAQDMALAGQTDLGQAIRALPMAFGGGTNRGVAPGAGNSGDNADFNGASTANLRGMGSGSTLTLVNGHRMSFNGTDQSVDISSIPTVAVERVEILADGSSALYGSDAVAGVVNVILKKRFDGLAASARIGTSTQGGGTQQQYNVIGGLNGHDAGVWIAYDYSKDNGITAGQRGYTSAMPAQTDLVTPLARHSVVASGYADVSETLSLKADAAFMASTYSYKAAYTPGSSYQVDGYANTGHTEQLTLAPSAELKLPGGWIVSLSGLYSYNNVRFSYQNYYLDEIDYQSTNRTNNDSWSVETNANGKIVDLPAGAIRASFGLGYRYSAYYEAASASGFTLQDNISSKYGYGEVFIPLVAPAMHVPGVEQLDFTAALRWEDYNTFGRSTTPKFGVIYKPVHDITVRASWGRSFKVPTFDQLYGSATTYLFNATPGYGGNFPDGSTFLFMYGGNSQLQPERSRSVTASLQYDPAWAPDFHVSGGYFNTAYRGRIGVPLGGLTGVFSNPLYAAFVTTSPSPAQVSSAIAYSQSGLINTTGATYDPASVAAILDDRFLNLTTQTYEGFDFGGSYRHAFSNDRVLTLTIDATYTDVKQQTLPTLPNVETAGQTYRVPHWKGRAGAVWQQGRMTFAGYVNYIGGLVDDPGDGTSAVIRPQATLDLSLNASLPHDISIGLSVLNALNNNPPLVAVADNVTIPVDTTNYSLVGRFIGLTVSKKF